MEMTVAGGGLIPGPLRPKLAFTGTSILTFDGKGKIGKHVDTWVRRFVFSPSSSLTKKNEAKTSLASLPPPPFSPSPFLFDSYQYFQNLQDALAEGKEQEYFSAAGFRNVLSQLADVRKPPAESSSSASSPLWSPPRQLLRKTSNYEIRRYDDLSAIEAPMGGGEGGVTGPGARQAFRSLASFITREKISMTTPVLSDSRAMRFVLAPGEAEARAEKAAAAAGGVSGGEDGGGGVAVSKVRGGIYAVASFGGIATDGASARAAEKLSADLAADGVKVSEGSSSPPFLLAQYNGPVTLPPFRLNEVLVPLDAEAFDLWKV